MKTKASKPRKPAKKPVARKRPVKPIIRKSEWIPAKDSPSPVARALSIAITAFKGDKSALCEYLGIYRPNLSRALALARDLEAGKKVTVSWPPQRVVGLSKVSGVPLHEIAPDLYEPHMKTQRFRPKFVDGKVQAGA